MIQKEYEASISLNDKIYNISKKLNIPINRGEIITSDVLMYMLILINTLKIIHKVKFLGCEMESFVLYYLANKLNKEASCLLTVVDSHYDDRTISSKDRETSLNNMIILALESII